jgi:hypothetical protein
VTSFVVPSYRAPGQGWQLTDYKPGLVLTAKAGADGSATVSAPTVEPGYMWAIQRAVSSSTSGKVPRLRLYDGSASAGNLLSGSNAGLYDEADYPAGPGMLVDQGRQLTAVWTGCDVGASCTLRLQVGVLQLVSAG